MGEHLSNGLLCIISVRNSYFSYFFPPPAARIYRLPIFLLVEYRIFNSHGQSLKCIFMQVFRDQSAGSVGIIKRTSVEATVTPMTSRLDELMAQLLISLHLSSHLGCGGNSWYVRVA